MPNGTSLIGTASSMTLSVAKGLTDTHAAMEEYRQHLERRKAHLESLLLGSHQDDVKAMLAEVTVTIDELEKAMAQVQEASERATKIEARL